MSLRLYCYRLKCLYRSKQVIFWSYLFPILLSSCFFFAFRNVYHDTITIAYDSNGAIEDELGKVLKEAKLSDDTPLFQITYCSEEEAKLLLKKDEIAGYIVGGETPQLYIDENGIKATIIKAFLDRYLQVKTIIIDIMQKNPNALNEGLIDDIMQFDTYVERLPNQKNPDSLLVYFYSLMAFACFNAANGGLDEVTNIQANQSACGARVNVSPIRKMKLFLCNLLASFTTHIISIIILFLHMYFILKINFGDSLLYLFIICFLGSLAGFALGATIGVWVKKKPEVKEAIVTSIVLGSGFLAGLMVVNIKYFIATKVPLLSYINPVNLVSDAMYSLYYYDTYNRYFLDASLLGIITIILIIASYIGIRRKDYASI